jgi:hypothetical protein
MKTEMTIAPAITSSARDMSVTPERSATHLKKIFDQSLAVLCGGKESVPLRRNSLPLHIDSVSLQKRALTDAANALTSLWKISDSASPKLRRNTLQFSR